MEPMAGNNYQSHQEKNLIPGLPGSRQGKAKPGIFPCHLPRNSFYPVFGDIFLVLPMPGSNQGFFPCAVARKKIYSGFGVILLVILMPDFSQCCNEEFFYLVFRVWIVDFSNVNGLRVKMFIRPAGCQIRQPWFKHHHHLFHRAITTHHCLSTAT